MTDGEPVEFRSFVGRMLRAAGVNPGDRELPRWAARLIANATTWMREPPLTPTALALMSHEVTVDDRRAREERGYRGAKGNDESIGEIGAQ